MAKKRKFSEQARELLPRERLADCGTAQALSSVELLAILLKTGSQGCSVLTLAQRLIDAFGGTEGLFQCDFREIEARIKQYNAENPDCPLLGMGRVKCLELAAICELARRAYATRPTIDFEKEICTVEDAVHCLRSALTLNEPREKFWVLPLDVKCKPMAIPQLISLGTANGVQVHPRDVFALAVRWNACSIIVAHNHPSGNPTPSQADVELTQRLIQAGKLMGIPLRDHIILAARDFYSFATHHYPPLK